MSKVVDLLKYIDENPSAVKKNYSKKHPNLFSVKYKNKVFFNNEFDDYLEETRGAVFSDSGELKVLPFTKIYNYGVEKRSPVIDGDELVMVYKKVNGFMGAVTYDAVDDVVIFSTTGSTDSTFVGYIEELFSRLYSLDELKTKLISLGVGKTHLFEVVHELDPHIITEEVGLYYLGYRDLDLDSKIDGFANGDEYKYNASVLGVLFNTGNYMYFRDVLALIDSVLHEGFVVYTMTRVATKMKSDYYRTLKYMARTKHFNTKDSFMRTTKKYHDVINSIVSSHHDEFLLLTEQERLRYLKEFIG